MSMAFWSGSWAGDFKMVADPSSFEISSHKECGDCVSYLGLVNFLSERERERSLGMASVQEAALSLCLVIPLEAALHPSPEVLK